MAGPSHSNIPWGSTMVNPSVAAPGLGMWIDLEVAKLGLQPNQPANAHHRFMTTRTHSQGTPFDDNYLYCDDCERYHLGDCSVHGPMQSIRDSLVSSTDPMKSNNSLPPGLIIGRSSIPGAGFGVFTGIDIRKGTVFGPYVGKIVAHTSSEALSSDYCWLIHGEQEPLHCIDGKDFSSSNWMRYVNCANNPDQQNLIAFQYKRYIFYRTYKMISSGTELLVWYGLDCAKRLGLSLTPSQQPTLVTSEVGSNDKTCSFCSKTFSRSSLLRKHVKDYHSTPVASDDFDCEFCSKSFGSYGSLHHHVGQVHPEIVASEDWECEFCLQSFPSDAACKRHVATKHKKEKAYAEESEKEEEEEEAAAISSSDEFQPDSHQTSIVRRGMKRRQPLRSRKESRQKVTPRSPKSPRSPKQRRSHSLGGGRGKVKSQVHPDPNLDEPGPISIVYICKVCKLLFRVFEEFCEHQEKLQHQEQEDGVQNKSMTLETKVRLYKCQLCNYASDFSNNVRTHLLNVHKKVVTYVCQTCKFEATVTKAIQRHLSESRHWGMDVTLVSKKKEQPTNPAKSTDETANGTPDKNSTDNAPPAVPTEDQPVVQPPATFKQRNCNMCTLIFTQAGGLKRHLGEIHKISSDFDSGDRQGRETNGIASNGTKAVSSHEKVSTKRSPKKLPPRGSECKICNMTFKRPTHLMRHTMESEVVPTTTEELTKVKKIHECHICAVAFRRSDQLLCHLVKIHKTRMSFVCSQCEEKFVAYFEISVHHASSNHSGVNLQFMSIKQSQPSLSGHDVVKKSKRNRR